MNSVRKRLVMLGIGAGSLLGLQQAQAQNGVGPGKSIDPKANDLSHKTQGHPTGPCGGEFLSTDNVAADMATIGTLFHLKSELNPEQWRQNQPYENTYQRFDNVCVDGVINMVFKASKPGPNQSKLTVIVADNDLDGKLSMADTPIAMSVSFNMVDPRVAGREYRTTAFWDAFEPRLRQEADAKGEVFNARFETPIGLTRSDPATVVKPLTFAEIAKMQKVKVEELEILRRKMEVYQDGALVMTSYALPQDKYVGAIIPESRRDVFNDFREVLDWAGWQEDVANRDGNITATFNTKIAGPVHNALDNALGKKRQPK